MTNEIKKLSYRVDAGLIAALLLSLFALLPLTTQDGIVHGHDTLLHAHRMAEMQRSWAHGLLMPTWAETFYYGYGSPVFHYYSPLAYYFGAALLIFGADVVTAIHLLIALSLLLAGAGMYLFVREHFGRAGGVLSAVCYVYSPYLLYTEPYTRGDYPELLAFALFPLVIWRFERLIRWGGVLDVVWAALSIVPLILSHNLMSVALFCLLVGWLIWCGLWRVIIWQRLALTLTAAALGVALMTYFWLPVALERGAVQIDNVELITQDRRRDFFEFFIPPSRLLAFNSLTDEGAVNGIQMHLNLGVAQWALAICGAIAGIILNRQDAALSTTKNTKREKVSFIVFFAAASLVMIMLMLPTAYPIWINFSPINYMVFPWRFLGPTAFCLAALAGANVLWLKRLPRHWNSVAFVGCLLAPLALSLPLLHMPSRYTAPLDTSVATYLQGEIDGSISLGTTAYNEFLPRTVYVIPDATQTLVDDFIDGYPVDPAHRENLPEGVSMELLEHHPERSVWQVNTVAAFTFEALIFDFSGWHVEIDGQPVTITPSDQHGLITFPVPVGEHTITLWLGSTPVRDVATGISVVAVIAMIGFSLYWVGKQKKLQTELSEESFNGWAFVAAGVIQVVIVAFFLREGVAWQDSPLGQAVVAQHQDQVQLGDQMSLVGYDVSTTEVRAGDQIEIVLYWYAPNPPTYNYSSFIHISTGGPPLAQLDKARVADRPAAAWTADGYLVDRYLVTLPETMPTGEYQILVGVYTCESRPAGECGNGDRLQVIGTDGEPTADSVLLGTLTVR
jgi:hypothetical protein